MHEHVADATSSADPCNRNKCAAGVSHTYAPPNKKMRLSERQWEVPRCRENETCDCDIHGNNSTAADVTFPVLPYSRTVLGPAS